MIYQFIHIQISDAYTGNRTDEQTLHLGLLYSLYITPFVCCIGAFCYFYNARYLYDDKNNVDILSRLKIETKQNSMLSSLPSDDSPYDDQGTSDTVNLIQDGNVNITSNSRNIRIQFLLESNQYKVVQTLAFWPERGWKGKVWIALYKLRWFYVK